jgi:hypothetical protein
MKNEKINNLNCSGCVKYIISFSYGHSKSRCCAKKPINCTTAEADISALMSAKEAEDEQKVGGLLSMYTGRTGH